MSDVPRGDVCVGDPAASDGKVVDRAQDAIEQGGTSVVVQGPAAALGIEDDGPGRVRLGTEGANHGHGRLDKADGSIARGRPVDAKIHGFGMGSWQPVPERRKRLAERRGHASESPLPVPRRPPDGLDPVPGRDGVGARSGSGSGRSRTPTPDRR